jgi:hypothetical protein
MIQSEMDAEKRKEKGGAWDPPFLPSFPVCYVDDRGRAERRERARVKAHRKRRFRRVVGTKGVDSFSGKDGRRKS